MELLRRRQHALGQECQLGRPDRKLPGPRAEDPASHADHISGVKQLVEFEIALRDLIAAHVDLDLHPALLEVGETSLALASLGHQATADACARLLVLEGLAVGLVECCPQVRDGMSRVVFVRVALEAQFGDPGDLVETLLEYAIFWRHGKGATRGRAGTLIVGACSRVALSGSEYAPTIRRLG